ncbi:hypothetical protein HGRIS_003960 [Hohenbuehelia grisea]|uniref:TEA domain-containing protein n=1 Tax=Hohenbuehelia grisea TaxID=104357 RepID=A0ABR3JHP1_9AGAR
MSFVDFQSFASEPTNSAPEFIRMSSTLHDFQESGSTEGMLRDASPVQITGRRTWKCLRGGQGEAVWPPTLEKALIEALHAYDGARLNFKDDKAHARFIKRNKFIADYINKVTGKSRTAKQVGSRLQQLRNTTKDDHSSSIVPFAHSSITSAVRQLLTLPMETHSPARKPRLLRKRSESPSALEHSVPSSSGSTSSAFTALVNSSSRSTPSSYGPSVPSSSRPTPTRSPPYSSSPFLEDHITWVAVMLTDSHQSRRPVVDLRSSSSQSIPLASSSFTTFPGHQNNILTLLSDTPLRDSCIFRVYNIDTGSVVYSEEANLFQCASGQLNNGWLYRTSLASGFWGSPAYAPDPTRYVIHQILYPRLESGVSRVQGHTSTPFTTIAYQFHLAHAASETRTYSALDLFSLDLMMFGGANYEDPSSTNQPFASRNHPNPANAPRPEFRSYDTLAPMARGYYEEHTHTHFSPYAHAPHAERYFGGETHTPSHCRYR